METVKVYLNETRIAAIVCGNCGKNKEFDLSQRVAPRSAVVKCSCGNTFTVSFERRQNYRKQVAIWGLCFTAAGPPNGEPVKIIDISAGGVKFQKNGRCMQPDQKLRIAFKLQDKTVNMVVSVRSVKNGGVGAKIIDMDAHSRKVLGFFLMP
ncbi:MAG: PilZ domain-containing protein [Syntrophobacteraceae bacterium]